MRARQAERFRTTEWRGGRGDLCPAKWQHDIEQYRPDRQHLAGKSEFKPSDQQIMPFLKFLIAVRSLSGVQGARRTRTPVA